MDLSYHSPSLDHRVLGRGFASRFAVVASRRFWCRSPLVFLWRQSRRCNWYQAWNEPLVSSGFEVQTAHQPRECHCFFPVCQHCPYSQLLTFLPPTRTSPPPALSRVQSFCTAIRARMTGFSADGSNLSSYEFPGHNKAASDCRQYVQTLSRDRCIKTPEALEDVFQVVRVSE